MEEESSGIQKLSSTKQNQAKLTKQTPRDRRRKGGILYQQQETGSRKLAIGDYCIY
jgi:hypothetical protein